MRVCVFQSLPASGKIEGDLIYWIGFPVAVVQLAIATVPLALYREWLTLLITATGTLLAFSSGGLPQWRDEKIGVQLQMAQAGGTQDVCLTAGYGSHDVLLILGCDGGLDFARLASPFRALTWRWTTRTLSLIFAALWIVLLISIAGYDQHTWYLLSIGLIGLLHNVLAASLPRNPRYCGIQLQYVETIVEPKAMSILMALEEKYPNAGRSLVDMFFPTKLWVREERIWEYAERRYAAWRRERRSDVRGFAWKMPPLAKPFDQGEDFDIPGSGPYTKD